MSTGSAGFAFVHISLFFCILTTSIGLQLNESRSVPERAGCKPTCEWKVDRCPRCHTGGPSVYLTFDDGPGDEIEQHSKVLADLGVHATYFWIGDNITKSKHESLKFVRDRGHAIGSHTMSHGIRSKYSWVHSDQIDREFDAIVSLIETKTGYRPTFFRPPYGFIPGSKSPAFKRMSTLFEHIYTWSLDTCDWDKQNTHTTDALLKRMQETLENRCDGSIILMHEDLNPHVDRWTHLEEVVAFIRAHCPGVVFRNLENGCACEEHFSKGGR